MFTPGASMFEGVVETFSVSGESIALCASFLKAQFLQRKVSPWQYVHE